MDTFQRSLEGQPACLPNTRIIDRRAASGEVWRLFVYLPEGAPPPDGWPLLVLTDGNAVIATAVDALRVQAAYPMGTDVQPGIIVAVGYPVDAAYDPLRRSIDLSPPPGRTYPPFTEGGPDVVTGGADRFLRFLEDDMLPYIGTLAPVDPARRTLFGHSFGGLFALHVLFSPSTAFRRFVAASPTIYWEDGLLLESEKRFAAAERDTDREVHLSAGAYEGEALAPFQYGREDTARRLDQARTTQTLALTQAMAVRLGALPGLSVACEVYPGETHMTMLPIAVSRAVRVAFRISD